MTEAKLSQALRPAPLPPRCCAARSFPAVAGQDEESAPRGRKELIVLKRDYPGRLTLEQWRALPRQERYDMAKRAQCDLLGSFRFCTNKTCRRVRSCSGSDPNACADKLWKRVKKKPKTLRSEYARIAAMPDA
jgi:hypothetical protein